MPGQQQHALPFINNGLHMLQPADVSKALIQPARPAPGHGAVGQHFGQKTEMVPDNALLFPLCQPGEAQLDVALGNAAPRRQRQPRQPAHRPHKRTRQLRRKLPQQAHRNQHQPGQKVFHAGGSLRATDGRESVMLPTLSCSKLVAVMLLIYRVLIVLTAPLALLWLRWKIPGPARLRARWRERLGSVPKTEGGALWIHAASVGEVNAIAPLAETLLHSLPRRKMDISTITITGSAEAVRRFKGRAIVILWRWIHPWRFRAG